MGLPENKVSQQSIGLSSFSSFIGKFGHTYSISRHTYKKNKEPYTTIRPAILFVDV